MPRNADRFGILKLNAAYSWPNKVKAKLAYQMVRYVETKHEGERICTKRRDNWHIETTAQARFIHVWIEVRRKSHLKWAA